MIDQADYLTQQVFFDDHADERDEKCCIDVRDVITGSKVHPKKFMNKYVVKVESHRAILEPDYFIKMLEMAEARRDEEVKPIQTSLTFILD
jgi:hypothetical protein